MKEENVSVIMSVYNESDYMLTKAIESILSQTFGNFEYIIVLDNPKNRRAERTILSYAQKDRRVVFIKNPRNIGLARSLNRGLGIAEHDLIARMDADDIALPGRLEYQVSYMRHNPTIDLVGADIEYIDEQDNALPKESHIVTCEAAINDLLPYGNVFNHPTWVFRRRMLEKVEGYREFSCSQDYDFLLRAKYYGYRLANMDKVLLKYRVRKTSISISRELYQLKMALYVQELYRQRLKTGRDLFDVRIVKEIDSSDLARFKSAKETYELAVDSFRRHQYVSAAYMASKSILASREQRRLFYNRVMIKYHLLKQQ